MACSELSLLVVLMISLQALKGIPRNSYYIGSKVGRYEKTTERMFDFSTEKTAAGVDNTLNLLGLDYVDLIQVLITY